MRCLAVLCVVGLSALCHADPRDYRIDSSGWNGLSRLADEAEAIGCRLAAADELDWARLGPRDVVFLVYPLSAVDPAAMADFLERGGRLLLADDFGSANDAFLSLELRRGPVHLEGVPRQPEHPELPVARARLLTTLGHATTEIVANHPAAFTTQLPATYVFSPGQALVVEGQVGKGRFVALADPSVLINNMLDLEGNRLFVRALLRDLCRPGSDGDRVHVLTGAFQTRATPRPIAHSGAGVLTRLNDVFSGLNQSMEQLGSSLTWMLSALMCVAAGFVAWAALGRQRADRHVDGSFTRAERTQTSSPTALVAAMAPDADHALPLLLLRAEVLRRLGAVLGPIPSGGPRGVLVQRARDRFGQDVATSLDRFFDTGPELAGGASPRRVSSATFESALDHARPVLACLPLSDVVSSAVVPDAR